uniref:Uncharacterized protein n=1 Tax=Rhizophora mucronata TaxID=61149 RepID=A0A2P2PSD4_RHIMU
MLLPQLVELVLYVNPLFNHT